MLRTVDIPRNLICKKVMEFKQNYILFFSVGV